MERYDEEIKAGRFEQLVQKAYRQWIFPRLPNELSRQRLKLLWFIWGYWPIVFLKNLSVMERLKILKRFLKVDLHIVHSHLPSEIAYMCRALTDRRAKADEVVVEAGCWKGGSAAKLSIVCKMLGYRLLIYDSFSGVETPSIEWQENEEKAFFGEYAAAEGLVRYNLEKYGEAEVCHIVKGWFSDTLAKTPVPHPVRLVYVDCDLLKGTNEVLCGVIPSLVEDGYIFSEDYHLQSVRNLLLKPGNLEKFGRGSMLVTPLGQKLACIRMTNKI
jgi:hypothetical protein